MQATHLFNGIDLFSDTVTRPTAAMKQAMMEAPVGDEQKGEDPSTLALEAKMAKMLGKSAALFFPSATMANEVAIKLWCEPGDELIADENCHLFFAEAGGPAVHSGVMAKPIATQNGIFTAENVRRAYRWSRGPHYPISKLVNVENTTNMGGGVAWPLETLDSVLKTANELGLKKHLDGSRLFHAVVKLNETPQRLAGGFDSVTICLSKGLGCPTGAVLAFDKEHFAKVRRLKQLMGGSMRQSGMLAAAGIYALDHHVERLKEDHQNATRLATLLNDIPAIAVENTSPSTNMVFFHWNSTRLSPQQFLEKCVERGVRFSQVGEKRFRAVTHLDISAKDIERAAEMVKEIAKQGE